MFLGVTFSFKRREGSLAVNCLIISLVPVHIQGHCIVQVLHAMVKAVITERQDNKNILELCPQQEVD